MKNGWVSRIFFGNLEYLEWYIGKIFCYFGIFLRVPGSNPPEQTHNCHHVYDFIENHLVVHQQQQQKTTQN